MIAVGRLESSWTVEAQEPFELARSSRRGSRCRTAVIPTASAPAQFSRRSSTNTAAAGSTAEPLAGEQVDLRLRLVEAHLAGDHGRVEQLGRVERGRRCRAPTSSRSGPSSRRPRAPRATAPSIARLGLEPGEHPRRSGPRGRRPPAARRSGARSRRRRARRSPARAAAASASGSPRNSSRTASGARPSPSQKAANAGPDARRQHAAEVDHQGNRLPGHGRAGYPGPRGHRRGRGRALVRRQRRRRRSRRCASSASPAAARTSPTRSPTPRAGAGRCAGRRSASGSPRRTTWGASSGSSRRSRRPPVPVPPAVGLSEEGEDPFYVMGWVEGPILRLAPRPRRSPSPATAGRSASASSTRWSRSTTSTPTRSASGDLARKEDYVARQLHRWHGQWEKQHTRELPLIDEVHDRLAARIPEQGPATIVHGDYRLDNMILVARRRGRRGRRLGAVHARRPARRRRPAARLLVRAGRRAHPALRAGHDGAGLPQPRRGQDPLRRALRPRPLARSTSTSRSGSGSSRSCSRASTRATRPASTASRARTRASSSSRASSNAWSRRRPRPRPGWAESPGTRREIGTKSARIGTKRAPHARTHGSPSADARR